MCERNVFADWCEQDASAVGPHKLSLLTERNGVRANVLPRLGSAVVAHYEKPERFQERMRRLGFEKAALILRSMLPQTPIGRSADLGEILATEAVPALLHPFHVPIKRLRWKDAREMAMRGEDLIGVALDGANVFFLKGEAKSRLSLAASVVAEARSALDRHDGRPSEHAMTFVMQRLWEIGEDELALIFEHYLLERRMTPDQLVHLCFVLCGNDAREVLTNDLASCVGDIRRHSVALQITDHQEFIRTVYETVSTNARIR